MLGKEKEKEREKKEQEREKELGKARERERNKEQAIADLGRDAANRRASAPAAMGGRKEGAERASKQPLMPVKEEAVDLDEYEAPIPPDGHITPGARRRIDRWLHDLSDSHLPAGRGKHDFPPIPTYSDRPGSNQSRVSSLRPLTGSTSATMAAIAADVQRRFKIALH